MRESGKNLVQRYAADATITAIYLGAITKALRLLVIAGLPPSGSQRKSDSEVIEIPAWTAPKNTLHRCAASISLFALRKFVATLRRTDCDGVVFSVTTPLTSPYIVAPTARPREAAAALLIYGLYREVVETAGLIGPSSLLARLLRLSSTRMYRTLSTIIAMGRDVVPLLLVYKGEGSEKIHFIPNLTLRPAGYRDIAPDHWYRHDRQDQPVVRLSGNLGFTHGLGPVFEAARLLKATSDIHFQVSGWGVSIPCCHYDLLAVGSAIIATAAPESEDGLVVEDGQIGWFVRTEDLRHLAEVICEMVADRVGTLHTARSAAADKDKRGTALAHYRQLIGGAANSNGPSE